MEEKAIDNPAPTKAQGILIAIFLILVIVLTHSDHGYQNNKFSFMKIHKR